MAVASEKPDMTLFILALVLVIAGLLMVFNAGVGISKRLYGDTDSFFLRQLAAAVLGIAVMIIFVFVPYRKVEHHLPVLLLGTVALLVLVLIPGIGKMANNARRWLQAGPLRLQPSEFAKLAVVLYLGRIMAKKQREGVTGTFRGFLPPLMVVLALGWLVFLEPDFSTAAMLLFTALAVFFAGGVPIGHLLGLIGSGLPVALLMVFSRSYMRERLLAFLDPISDLSDNGYHIVQSLISFQKGGVFGNGLGSGVQKMGNLPESHTDFILAAHAEEIGAFGVSLLLVLLFLLVWRLFRLSLVAPDQFSRLTVFGIAVLIGWQSLINAGVVTGILPTTGLPLPFISYGGSSLVMFCLAIGIALNISRTAEWIRG